MLTRGVLVLLALAISVHGIGASARQERIDDARARMTSYQALLSAYHSGDATAVERFARWRPSDVEAALRDIESDRDPITDWEPWRFKSAIMLQTDAALARHSDDVREMTRQFEHAEGIVRRALPAIVPFGVAWNASVASWLRRRQEFATADQLLDAARRDLDDPPELLYESGITDEQLGAAFRNAREFGPYALRRSVPGGVPLGIGVANFEQATERAFQRARTSLERAARAMPQHTLVRLHLARVLLLTGQYDDALVAARAGEATRNDAAAAYVGALLAGAIEEHRGHLDEAVKHYRHAIALFPDGQFAYIAVSEAESRAGRFDAAGKAIASMLARDSERAREPWWFFVWEPADGKSDPFEAVRQEARQ